MSDEVPWRVSKYDVGEDAVVVSAGNTMGTVRIFVEFGAGSASAPPGLANLAIGLLDRGTVRHQRTEQAERLDAIAASFGGHTLRSRSRVILRCLQSVEADAVDWLLDALTEPADLEDEVARLGREVESLIDIELERPSGAADRELGYALWPDPSWGPPEDVVLPPEAMSSDEISAARRTLFSAPMTVGVASEDVSAGRALGEAICARVRARIDVARPRSVPPRARFGVGRWVEVPNAPQPSLTGICEGPTRRASDWSATQVAIEAFGGAFDTPLIQTIRSELGLAYSVGASLASNRGYGFITLSMAPDAERCLEAAERAVALWNAWRSDGIDEVAVEAAKRRLLTQRRLSLETVAQRLGAGLRAVRLGMSLDDERSMTARIAEVRLADVRAAADRWGFHEDVTWIGAGTPVDDGADICGVSLETRAPRRTA